MAEIQKVVITGIGMITPLGHDPEDVLRRIRAGALAAAPPENFNASAFDCPVCARVQNFEPQRYVSETKLVRLMNRDAQLAVAAARLALQDAGVKPGTTHRPEEIGLFGATGLAGLPLREVTPLIRISSGPGGVFDLARFGQAGLKAVSPILSFKILSNMPFCFVSINENIQGVNGIYTPWEGEGAQAVEAGIRALQFGDARCVLVGACDVKTHELAFASLQQRGLFDSWKKRQRKQDARENASGHGLVPGEGAAFLVLETEQEAQARRARIYAQVKAFKLRVCFPGEEVFDTRTAVLRSLGIRGAEALVSSANGDPGWDEQESIALNRAGISLGAPASLPASRLQKLAGRDAGAPSGTSCGLGSNSMIHPKKHAGDLFAGAALLQIGLGAMLARSGANKVLANCFGYGSTQAAFVLENELNRGEPV